MGAPMETKPTQHGLMNVFTSQGLATDNSLTALEERNSDTKGFAGLLSGYLPRGGEQLLNGINSNLLPLPQMSASGDHSLNFADVADESLPLSGQTLPLEQTVPPLTSSVELSHILTVENATAKGQSLAKSESDKDLLASLQIDSASSDASTQLLEDQGFYAQSLVSSLIGSSAIPDSGINVSAATNLNNVNTASLSGESAKAVSVMPQKIVNGINLQNLSASELDAMGDETTDRFLGSEPVLSPLKSKKSATLESMPALQSIAPLMTPTVMQNQVSLALALNEDPTTQSLGDLIEGEVLEKGEFETKLNTLERKQDDQTLKLSKGQQAWGDAITERITMNAAKDIKQVTIHLDPPELGSLELKLQIKDDQQAHVQVQVQNPQVKEALESSAQRLREMLASQGLELSEFDVQTDSGRGEQSPYGSDDQGHGQSQNSDTSQHSTEEMSIQIPKAKNNNLLDTFV
ncbi:MAG: flagellar hook-length control protein FliK [Oleispira sp.]|jgi:flagellar hook-length control protein FliK